MAAHRGGGLPGLPDGHRVDSRRAVGGIAWSAVLLIFHRPAVCGGIVVAAGPAPARLVLAGPGCG
ncbi:hypothetical protein [Streptomyces violaceorubidus]|uniref:Uncharacterized protein n=1 Tax=Streptomyces violaceorubidus TaxID=284042 RepID=A0ABV1SVB9_9ACTN